MGDVRVGNAIDWIRARDAEVKRADVFGELKAEQVQETAGNKRAGETVASGSFSVSADFVTDSPDTARARAVEFVEAFLSMAKETGLDVKLSGRLVKR